MVAPAIVVCLFAWLFAPVLIGTRGLVLRDAAHFYHPLYRWTADEWAAGRLPTWNPLENCGTAALADSSSAVLYPGKLLFLLPLDFTWRYNLYIAVHAALAAAAVFAVARRWRASSSAAALAAMSYAFGGVVLFQANNVVFLVGAAWLPVALLAADWMLVRRRLSGALALAAVLALMTLGGDPQSAYHAGLMVVLYALILWWRSPRIAPRAKPVVSRSGAVVPRSPPVVSRSNAVVARSPDRDTRPFWLRLARHRLVLLGLAGILAAGLAAMQVLPSIERTRRSDRASFDAPRSLYEIPTALRRSTDTDDADSIADGPVGRSGERGDSGWPLVARGILGPAPPGTHAEQIYQFSVPPIRLVELAWPNCLGRPFPEFRRWTQAAGLEGYVWTPSLYMGLLPVLAALAAFRLCGGTRRQQWLSWTALLAGIGVMGVYGIGWLMEFVRCKLLAGDQSAALLGDPVGGLYWLMVVVLPGYAYFRYPAKLLTVAALAMSLLAARGWDEMAKGNSRRIRDGLLVLGIASAAAAALIWMGGSQFDAWLSSAPGDLYFGPFDSQGALRDFLGGMIHAAIVCGLLWWLLAPRGRDAIPWKRYVALVLTAVELAVAHGWMLQTAPSHDFRAPSLAAQMIAQHEESGTGALSEADESAPVPLSNCRVFRASAVEWTPPRFRIESSSERCVGGLIWDRDTLFPKYQLLVREPDGGIALVESPGSIVSRDFQAVMDAARRHGVVRPDGLAEPHRGVLDALATRYIILPGKSGYAGTERVAPATTAEAGEEEPLEDAALWYNPHALPRAWIVHDVESLPPLSENSPQALLQRTEEVYFPDGELRDLRKSAVVESRDAIEIAPAVETDSRVSTCRFVRDEPNRIEIAADLAAPGLLVISDAYDPGWTAEVIAIDPATADESLSDSNAAGQRVPVLRSNRVMRGIPLPAGSHRVILRYQPTSLYTGAAISAACWIVWLAAAACCCLALAARRRKRQCGGT